MDRQKQNFLTKEEKEAIHKILLRILEKWRSDLGEREEELVKTVILSPGSATRQEPSSLESPEESEETLAATIILPPKEGRPRPTSAPLPEKTKGDEPLSKTEEFLEKDEFLEETVILKPKKVREKLNE